MRKRKDTDLHHPRGTAETVSPPRTRFLLFSAHFPPTGFHQQIPKERGVYLIPYWCQILLVPEWLMGKHHDWREDALSISCVGPFPLLLSLPKVPLGQCPHCRVSLCTRILYSLPSLVSAAPFYTNMTYFKLGKAEHGIFLDIKQPPNPSTPGQQRRHFSQKPQSSQHLIQNFSETQGLWYMADDSSRE